MMTPDVPSVLSELAGLLVRNAAPEVPDAERASALGLSSMLLALAAEVWDGAAENLIQENRAVVQDLVNEVLGAGVWLDAQRANRDKAVTIAAGRGFFNQDPNILRFVMENPTDRVTYGDLRMVRSEFEELMELSLAAGTIKRPIPYETYVDDSFARSSKPAVIEL